MIINFLRISLTQNQAIAFIVLMCLVFILGVMIGRRLIPKEHIKYYGKLVIEPDNAGALVDLDDIPKNVMGGAKDGQDFGITVIRMPIDEYVRRKEHVREPR